VSRPPSPRCRHTARPMRAGAPTASGSKPPSTIRPDCPVR
jgi:hypothetical protein